MTECYYKLSESNYVRGVLTLKYDHMLFESLKQDIQMTVDYLDIGSLCRVPVDNPRALACEDSFVRQNFQKQWLLQISLTSLNGLSYLKYPEGCELFQDKSIVRRSTIEVGAIYLQVMHEDFSAGKHLLIDREQSIVLN